jgi:phosphoribosylamine--glycine ligase
MQEIIYPTLRGLANEGIHYRGFLYAGLMITPEGRINVLEFNCRLGDPETQVLLPRLKSDLAAVCLSACQDTLTDQPLEWDPRFALGVVLTADGYPEHYAKGEVITGATQTYSDGKVFHSGTSLRGEVLVTDGGRVLCVTALGEDVAQAQQKAYDVAKTIHWPNQYYRTDIGYRAIPSK